MELTKVICYNHMQLSGVFRSHSNIYDGVFWRIQLIDWILKTLLQLFYWNEDAQYVYKRFGKYF